jgi:two-component system LytT family sensor kinase
MKVILRVPKFFPGVRPDLPKFGADDSDITDTPKGNVAPTR